MTRPKLITQPSRSSPWFSRIRDSCVTGPRATAGGQKISRKTRRAFPKKAASSSREVSVMSVFMQLLLTWVILVVMAGLIVHACTRLVPRRRRDPHGLLPVTGPVSGPAPGA